MSLENSVELAKEMTETENNFGDSDELMRESPASPAPTEVIMQGKNDNSPLKRHSEEEEAFWGSDNSNKANDPAWDEERRHYQKIVRTFKLYGDYVTRKVNRSGQYLGTLTKTHQRLLRDYRKHLHEVKWCIQENHNLCMLIILEESRLFENQNEVYPSKNMKTAPPEPSNLDFDKIQAVFKQIVRDWSVAGEKERELCYKPIIDEVEFIFSKSKNENGFSPVKILVPGAGLGRLAHELVKKGYVVEGNEFSLFMLFASNFLLNKCNGKEVYKCYPWIHQTTNVLNKSDQIRPVSFPDVDPGDLPPNSRFSMTAGDFLEVYGVPSHEDAWDCVVTCFFIDCGNNIVALLERIYYCLKQGGTWINLGPLLYHYADLPDEQSIEPPFDILLDIIKKIGFDIQKQLTNVPTLYADNSKSMLSYTYNSVFLVCKKPGNNEPILDSNSNTNDSGVLIEDRTDSTSSS